MQKPHLNEVYIPKVMCLFFNIYLRSQSTGKTLKARTKTNINSFNSKPYVLNISPEFCNAHYCELYFSPLYKRVLLCQEIFIFVLYNLVQ